MKIMYIALIALMAGASSVSAQTLTQPTDMVAKPVDPNAKPKPKPELVYLSKDFLANPGLIVPAPYAPDSVEGKADLEAAKAIQAKATPERIAQAAWDDTHEDVWLYTDTIGAGFVESKLPATAKLFKGARNDQNIEGNVFKEFFHRSRPYEVDHAIKTCVTSYYGKAPRSYPSGHTTLGYSLGVLLAHLIPEKADAILKRARDYGTSRVICGVHFPSDLPASQVLGTSIALELMKNPAFIDDFKAAKAELVAAGLTQ